MLILRIFRIVAYALLTLLTLCVCLREELDELVSAGKTTEIINILTNIEAIHGSLWIDDALPTLYTYKGVALFESNRYREAADAFKEAVKGNPSELRAWINLAQILPGLGESVDEAVRMIEQLSGKPFITWRFEKALWDKVEDFFAKAEHSMVECISMRDHQVCEQTPTCLSVYSPDNVTITREVQEFFWEMSFNSTGTGRAPLNFQPSSSILNIGIILSRFEFNPVTSLAQGFFQRLKAIKHVHLIAFVLSSEHQFVSDWVSDLFGYFHEVFYLDNMNPEQSAALIRAQYVQILIEMNGAGLMTGLNILAQRAAPIQLTFLGDPYTIGSPQVDYFLGDPIASPPEFAAAAFTERLVLLPHPYLISSYASWQPKVLTMKRMDKSSITNYLSLPPQQRKQWQDTVIFGSFHGPTKIDPTIFHVWMNILRNVPRGYLVLFGGDKYREANTNRLNYARHYGLNIDQINFLRVAKWDEHLHMKSAFDLFLDTTVKNGHTTTVDAAYAGVPIVGLGSRVPVSGRSTASVTHYLGADQGIVYSLKEYEDMVAMLSKSRYGAQVLKGWRREGELARKRSTVFDIDFQTRSLVDAFEAMVDIGVVVNRSSASFQYRTRRYPYSEWGGFSHFHLFASFARDP